MEKLIDKIDVHPADWFGTRLLTFIPKHFTKVNFEDGNRLKMLSWIDTHTSGRFAIAETNTELSSLSVTKISIGFEDPAEATMFIMFFKP